MKTKNKIESLKKSVYQLRTKHIIISLTFMSKLFVIPDYYNNYFFCQICHLFAQKSTETEFESHVFFALHINVYEISSFSNFEWVFNQHSSVYIFVTVKNDFNYTISNVD